MVLNVFSQMRKTNPTLHNMDIIKNLDLKIGDHIVVSRHGENQW